MRLRIFLFSIIFLGLIHGSGSAQGMFQEDLQEVPFIWGHSWGVGARALGMGGAYTAVADDYPALYYNPAGLGQVKKIEAFGGFSHLSTSDQATFLGDETEESASFTKLSSAGVVVPVPTYRGSLVLAAGYHRVQDFDNFFYATRFLSSPGDSVTWEHQRLEEGGLGNISFGGSMETAPGVFLGASVNFWTGSDDWTWQFVETDEPYDLYTFSTYELTTQIHTDFSGVNFALGALFLLRDGFRLGGTIVTPVTLTGKEEWDFSEYLLWDADSTEVYSDFWPSEYKVQFPWIFRVGGSFQAGPLMVCADVEFKDYGQIKYKTDPPMEGISMGYMNNLIKRNFQNTVNTRFGGELEIPDVGVKLRAGYGMYPSPFKSAPWDQDRNVLSFGAGFSVWEEFTLDVAYASTSWERIPYWVENEKIENETMDVKKIVVTLSYHYEK